MATLAERRSAKPGILRLDLTDRARRTSAVSVEFKDTPDWMNPADKQFNVEPDSAQSPTDRLTTSTVDEEKAKTNTESPAVDKVRFTNDQQQLPSTPEAKAGNLEEEDEEDEYSASVSAIMVRQANRQSWNKRSFRRRGSSPFSPDQESAISNLRRRSSVFTTSSGDTAIDIEEKIKQEQIYQQIKLHKEVLSQVKYQPWPIRKKLKLVQTAKAYIKQHEGALQERLAHNRRTKDVLAHFNILIVNQWNHLKRELLNMSNLLIPWELRIKEIESHFGSVVASYFIFLRWLFSVNLVIAIVLITFIAVPEVLKAHRGEESGGRKEMLDDEKKRAANLVTLWNFEGVLKYSPLFYGYYNVDDEGKDGVFRYRLPLAYFTAGLAVYMYSFVAILRK